MPPKAKSKTRTSSKPKARPKAKPKAKAKAKPKTESKVMDAVGPTGQHLDLDDGSEPTGQGPPPGSAEPTQ
jgi:hypothetical protein